MRKAKERIIFDPRNSDHRLEYAYFMRYGNWKNTCKFALEEPFEDIPSMISNKIVRDSLSSLMVGIL